MSSESQNSMLYRKMNSDNLRLSMAKKKTYTYGQSMGKTVFMPPSQFDDLMDVKIDTNYPLTPGVVSTFPNAPKDSVDPLSKYMKSTLSRVVITNLIQELIELKLVTELKTVCASDTRDQAISRICIYAKQILQNLELNYRIGAKFVSANCGNPLMLEDTKIFVELNVWNDESERELTRLIKIQKEIRKELIEVKQAFSHLQSRTLPLPIDLVKEALTSKLEIKLKAEKFDSSHFSITAQILYDGEVIAEDGDNLFI